MVSLITLNHRWQGDMVGPVGGAAAACRGLIRFSQSEPPLRTGRVADRAANGIRGSRQGMAEPIPNMSQGPTLHRRLALFMSDLPGIRGQLPPASRPPVRLTAGSET